MNRRTFLYTLCLLPTATDLIETEGRIPKEPLEWSTELIVGMILAVLIWINNRQHASLLAQVRSDSLTGLLNRRAFGDEFRRECARSRRFGQPLTLLFLDVDDFKEINDTLGHTEGDRVLIALGEVLRMCTRKYVDTVFRLGGDEFAVLLPGGALDEGYALCERIREAVTAWDFDGLTIGVSVGAAQLSAQETDLQFLHRADKEMYRDKRAA